MMSLEARLRDECETLRERVRQLEELLVPAVHVPLEWRLAKQEARLFAALTTREWVRHEALDAAIRLGSDGDGGRIVPVIAMRLRRKTARFGVVIETVWGEGYRLVDRERWARILA